MNFRARPPARRREGVRHGALRAVFMAGLVVAAGAADACQQVPERPGVLIVVVDSLRADHLHHAGDPRPLSPTLDRVAAEGTRFTEARTSAPWTTPSVMTLFTGLAPTTHHVDNNDRQLDRSVQTLAERFHQAGYRTAAVMPALTLADHFGFARGFDRFTLEVKGHGGVSGNWTVDEAIRFLADGDRPFFLYAHFWDVHYNYTPPVPYALRFAAGRRAGAGETDDVTAMLGGIDSRQQRVPLAAERVAWLEGQYAGEILFTDTQIGRLLAHLARSGLDRDTIVVVMADHGEGFQEHGFLGHTVAAYDELERVPLLVRWPGRIAAGRELTQTVGLIDMAPTLLDLAGVPYAPEEFEGRSRAAALLGGADHPPVGADEEILVATSRRGRVRGLVSSRMAYLFDFATRRAELYDLDADPAQQHDLAGERPEEAERWRRKLCERLARVPGSGEIPAVALPPQIRQTLDAGLGKLGYLGAEDAESSARRQRDVEREDAPAERRRYLAEMDCPGAVEIAPRSVPPAR
ncbi:MAG: sulfatase [Acidobacteriota bacterium]